MPNPSLYVVPGKELAADDAVSSVLHRYERSRRELVDQNRDKWKDLYDGYRTAMEVPEDSLTSSLGIPLIFTTVEDFLARVANTPVIETWGRGGERDSRRANHHRYLLEYDWQALKLQMKLLLMIKSAEIYGTGFMKVTHRKSVQRRLVRSSRRLGLSMFGLNVGLGTRSRFSWEDSVIWNDPWCEVLNIDEVFPDPDGKSLSFTGEKPCQWVVHETSATLDDLKAARLEGEPLYKNLGELEELVKDSNTKQPFEGNAETVEEHARNTFDGMSNLPADQTKREVTLLEMWTWDRVVTVVREHPRLKPIRNAGNPFGHLPILEFTPIPSLHSIYGISPAEVLYSMQVELQTLHESRMDNLLYAVHQMYTVIRNSGVNPHDLRYSPNGVVWVRNHNSIAPLRRDPIDFSVYRESQEIDRWAQKAGSTDTFSGLAAGGGTATEASVLAEASGSKAGLMIQVLGWQFLGDLARQLMRVNELFIDEERFIRLAGDAFTGESFHKVDPHDLVSGSGMDMDATIDLARNEPLTAAQRLQRTERFLAVLAQLRLPLDHPLMSATFIDYARGTKLSPNPEALILGDSARQSLAAQAQAEQSQAIGATPGSGTETQGQAIAAELGDQLGGVN
ncbi:MAG: hypothetical protein ACE5NA_00130 [Nitrospiraceae bacterium]